MLYGPTNEEMITEIFRAYVRSYKDLPLNLYHIQWKFRDEVRPRFGVMRGARIPDEGRLFVRPRLRPARGTPTTGCSSPICAPSRAWACKSIPMRPTPARSAAISATSSSSWPTPARAKCSATATISTSRCPAPTSTSTTSPACRRSSTNGPRSMRRPPRSTTPRPSRQLPADRQVSARGIEVGHIFYFGTKYSEPMKARGHRPRRRGAAGPHGLLRHRPERGSSPRIIEACHDDAGIIWPEAVAPFNVGAPQPQAGRRRDRRGLRAALSRISTAEGIDVLYDDRDERPGAKFATADLIGLPWQVMVGPKASPRARSS